MARLLIVSNRSPVTVRVEDGVVQVDRSTGGLATGLTGPARAVRRALDRLDRGARRTPPDQEPRLQARLDALRIVPVPLSTDEIERSTTKASATASSGRSSITSWTSFRSRLADFDVYERVNERFAEVVAAHHRPGDLVWVHDYQLMRVPQLLRAGFPTPASGSSCTFRSRPRRSSASCPGGSELLQGLLGADLIGFHTASYMRHFASSVPAGPRRGDGGRSPHVGTPDRPAGRLPDGHRRRGLRGARGGARRDPRSRGLCGAREDLGSCSASTGSTTPRAFRDACSPSSALLERAPGAPRSASGSSRWPCPRATNVRGLPGLPGAGGRAHRPDQRRLRHAAAGRRSTTSSAACRSARWWRSTGPPTSCW